MIKPQEILGQVRSSRINLGDFHRRMNGLTGVYAHEQSARERRQEIQLLLGRVPLPGRARGQPSQPNRVKFRAAANARLEAEIAARIGSTCAVTW